MRLDGPGRALPHRLLAEKPMTFGEGTGDPYLKLPAGEKAVRHSWITALGTPCTDNLNWMHRLTLFAASGAQTVRCWFSPLHKEGSRSVP